MEKLTIKHTMKDVYLYFNSPRIYNPILPENVKSILFVCKGNICRSPFAEHISNKIASEPSFKRVVSCSAGLNVPAPMPSPYEVLETAEKFGVNLNAHQSIGITSTLAECSDMIIAMESWHVIQLRGTFPKCSDKTFLLPLLECKTGGRKWSYRRYNIEDPYGKPLPYFHECFHRIEKCINELYSTYFKK